MNCPKQTKFRPGSLLIELMAALTLLTTISFIVLRGSMDLLTPRQSVLHQNLSDSYLTFEEAFAARVSFAQLTADDSVSPWPVFPEKSEIMDVEVGLLPGNPPRPILGTITRTRIADSNNLPTAGGIGNASTNPAATETWRLQSHLTYKIGNQTYVKSRTMIRTQ